MESAFWQNAKQFCPCRAKCQARVNIYNDSPPAKVVKWDFGPPKEQNARKLILKWIGQISQTREAPTGWEETRQVED